MAGNPRRGNTTAIKRSLTEFGQHRPVVARRSDNTVIIGNHMLAAATALGWTKIAAVFVDDDNERSITRSLADNRASDLSSYDDDELLALIHSVSDDNLLLAANIDQSLIDSLTQASNDYATAADDFERHFDGSNEPANKQPHTTTCPQCGYSW